jgi:hypothetical protein
MSGAVSWNEADDEALLSLKGMGFYASEIAAKLGRSRNSVIGRLHRLRIANGHAVAQRTKKAAVAGGTFTRAIVRVAKPLPKANRMTRAELPKPKLRVVWTTEEVMAAREAKARGATEQLHLGAGKRFVDIGPVGKECRWPHGDPRNLETFRFCGAVTEEGHSYCRVHEIISTNRA